MTLPFAPDPRLVEIQRLARVRARRAPEDLPYIASGQAISALLDACDVLAAAPDVDGEALKT
jgi:hypothetical protein